MHVHWCQCDPNRMIAGVNGCRWCHWQESVYSRRQSSRKMLIGANKIWFSAGNLYLHVDDEMLYASMWMYANVCEYFSLSLSLSLVRVRHCFAKWCAWMSQLPLLYVYTHRLNRMERIRLLYLLIRLVNKTVFHCAPLVEFSKSCSIVLKHYCWALRPARLLSFSWILFASCLIIRSEYTHKVRETSLIISQRNNLFSENHIYLRTPVDVHLTNIENA